MLNDEQKSKLSRDYEKYPIKMSEPLDRNDLYYLYIQLNLGIGDTSKIFKIPAYRVAKYLHKYEIKKSKYAISEQRKQTCLKKYGTEWVLQSPEIKQKRKEKCLQKYGCAYYVQSSDFRVKAKQTCLERYGVDNTSKLPENREKAKQTCLAKYGVDNVSKAQAIKDKIKQTINEHYGANTYCQSELYDKEKEMKKREQTNLERYGVTHPLKLEKFKQKRRMELMKKYGVINVTQIPEVREKIHKTMVKNNSFGKSKGERYIEEKLKQKFNRIELQYGQDSRYPFNCDFYIPELDLFIEYQGYQGHGGRPYLDTDEDQKILDKWYKKSKEVNLNGSFKTQYLGYIYTWSVSDPIKRDIAKKNNLNWLEFFNLKEFDVWYNLLGDFNE